MWKKTSRLKKNEEQNNDIIKVMLINKFVKIANIFLELSWLKIDRVNSVLIRAQCVRMRRILIDNERERRASNTMPVVRPNRRVNGG